MPAETVERPKSRLRQGGGILVLMVAVVAWFWPASPALLRLAPAALECWHDGLKEQAGLYQDQAELLPLANQPFETFAAKVLENRWTAVEGAEWESIFRAVAGASGRWCNDLPAETCRRVDGTEESHVNALFYGPHEAPFGSFADLPPPGEYRYVRLGARPETLMQILHIPAGTRGGKVHGCRWYHAAWSIPEAFEYPFRRYSAWIGGGGLLWLLAGWFGRGARALRDAPAATGSRGHVNLRKRSARIALAFTLLAIAIIPALHLYPLVDDYNLIGATVLAGFFVMVGVIASIMLGRSAVRLDRIMAGEGQLARWEYSASEWPELVAAATEADASEKRMLLVVVGVIMLVVGGGFVIADPSEASLVVLAVLGALFLLLLGIVTLVPPARRRRMLSMPGVALIAEGGVYFAGNFHDFRSFTTTVDRAAVEMIEGRPFLLVQYSFIARYGKQTETARVPVPAGRKEEADAVVETLNRLAS